MSIKCNGSPLPATIASSRCFAKSFRPARGSIPPFSIASRAIRRRIQRAVVRAPGAGGRRRDSRRSSPPPSRAARKRPFRKPLLALAGEGENLCLAGGLFFNALLVEFLESSGRWKNVFVQAAAGNAGTALGAVFHVWHQVRRHTRRTSDGSLLLGPSYSAEEIKQVLENCKLRFQYLRSTDEMLARAVALLGEHKILAWMQGRMEFGPRALGNRSILASPLDPYSTENLNIFIKHREKFRKFAASVPAELAAEYFEVGPNARNLATVGRVRPEHRKTFESAILGGERSRSGARPRRRRGLQSAVSPPAARSRKSHRPAGAVQHQLQSCSAIRWSRRRAMPCAVFIPRASTRCSWGIFCWRSEPEASCEAGGRCGEVIGSSTAASPPPFT